MDETSLLPDSLAWMAWTWQTAAFFATIALLLAIFTVLAVRFPERERVGVLRIPTTRGDRLFITLLGSAFICLGWMAFASADLRGDLTFALPICLVYALAVFRFV
ncbi:DUF2160 domain-containing protein [Ancylobacter sp. 6x-1]|uniref:DUF2160 domain-containing protein n=1 Tax=Ancylobacter crimeensis TaxID=2579147 RepID=A0ABT0DBT1_9HYPH|nr:DUF2160 domain-containing protein [Ancylobacter crimeensis]MCK0197329.1 DUF2160 domain-containing protein [Ancylobacter crimeensis]